MRRYLAIVMVLLLSCGLVGYGSNLPGSTPVKAADSAPVDSADSSEQVLLIEESSAARTQSVSAVPTRSAASFALVGVSSTIRDQIVEPVLEYIDNEVSVQLAAAEEERLAEEEERANRDESQRVYSTAMVGSVVGVEDMKSASSAPTDQDAILFSTIDALGNKVLFFNENGELKIWSLQTSKATRKEEGSEDSLENSLDTEETYENSDDYDDYEDYDEYVEDEEFYYDDLDQDDYYEEDSYEDSYYEEESYDEESYDRESDEEAEDSTEDESSEDSEESTWETPALPEDGEYYYSYASQVFDMTNELRASLGIAPLSWDGWLADFAATRAKEITISFSHYRPGGGHYSQYGPDHENLAWGYRSPEAVFEGWATSYDHYNNLTDPTMSSVGISCYYYEGILYWVMSFW